MESLQALAMEIAASVEDGEGDGVRLRLVRQFIMDTKLGDADRMLSGKPDTTGDKGWDAFVAGLGEYVSHLRHVKVPSWTNDPSKVLGTWWFLIPFPKMHSVVFVETPPEFANRGVFLRRSSLINV
jgi:hypothetical protein